MEELQSQVNRLSKRLEKVERENMELHKQLRKYDKGIMKGGGSSTNRFDQQWSRSDINKSRNDHSVFSSPSHSSDDEKKSKRSKVGTRFVSEAVQSVDQLLKQRTTREEQSKKEDQIFEMQIEALRKCNQYLSILVGDYNQKWNSFQDIDIMKENETIKCNRLQTQIDKETKQFVVICEVNLWDSEQKFRTAKELFECYQHAKEDILIFFSSHK